MAKLTVIVPLLNKRSLPVDDTANKGNVTGKVKAGFQFESVEQLTNAAGDWFRDKDGSWYWGGGLNTLGSQPEVSSPGPDNVQSFLDSAQFPPKPIQFNKMLVKFPANIKSNNGRGIKIAVLDSGVDETHLDLSKNILNKKDFTNAAAGENDIIGHGTSMCSLIAANSFFPDKGVSGVSSAAEIISAKVMYDKNNPQDFLSVGRGIDFAVSLNADIVNLSIGREEDVDIVAKKITSASNTIFIAATKQFQDTQPGELLQFPARCPEVIPVAALPKDYILQNWDKLPSPLLIIPHFKQWCCNVKSNNYYTQNSGSSVSTAIVSGCVALILAENPSLKRDKQTILAELEKYTSTVDEAFLNPGQEIHFIIKK